jgi:hypothetical protein
LQATDLHSYIHLFCVTGFASDGKGGVNADELCQVVRTLLYNLVGEHAGVWSEVQARMNGVKDLNSNKEQERILRLRELLTEICEGILAFDRYYTMSSCMSS